MNIKNTHKKTITKSFLWLLVALLLFTVLHKIFYRGKDKITTSSNKKEIAFPYRVIPALDNSQYLIAYQFYKNDSEDAGYGAVCTRFPKFSAVMKNINPANDDYKTSCKSIISDIIRTTGTSVLEINIYDDYEAYQLTEVDDTQLYKGLNKSEQDLVEKHTIATFDGDINGDYEEHGENNILQFYPQAHNHYTEHEKFEPKKLH